MNEPRGHDPPAWAVVPVLCEMHMVVPERVDVGTLSPRETHTTWRGTQVSGAGDTGSVQYGFVSIVGLLSTSPVPWFETPPTATSFFAPHEQAEDSQVPFIITIVKWPCR